MAVVTQAEVRSDGKSGSLHDAERYPAFEPAWLDREWWLAQGARGHDVTGRAGVLMLDRGDETWVYRHYHRGGFISRFIYDTYLWSGAERSRSFREWRLLAQLSASGLPVPQPVAARVVRSGFSYRADIVTVLLPDTAPLSGRIHELWNHGELWPDIGKMIAAVHSAGCDHPDLTAHNILIDGELRPFLVDFDNARLRPPGSWREAGLARLQRSLRKVAGETNSEFSEVAWRSLVAAYESGLA